MDKSLPLRTRPSRPLSNDEASTELVALFLSCLACGLTVAASAWFFLDLSNGYVLATLFGVSVAAAFSLGIVWLSLRE